MSHYICNECKLVECNCGIYKIVAVVDCPKCGKPSKDLVMESEKVYLGACAPNPAIRKCEHCGHTQ